MQEIYDLQAKKKKIVSVIMSKTAIHEDSMMETRKLMTKNINAINVSKFKFFRIKQSQSKSKKTCKKF